MTSTAGSTASAEQRLAPLALALYGASLGTTTLEAALRACLAALDADIAIHELREDARAEPLERVIITRAPQEDRVAGTPTGPRAIGCIVPVRPGMHAQLHLARTRGAFPDDARELLCALAPHLCRAIAARLRISAQSTSARLCAAGFEALGLAAARYGEDGRFLGANAAMTALAARRDGVTLSAGGIGGVERAETAALASAMLGAPAGGGEVARLRLRRAGSPVPYVLGVRAAAGQVIVTMSDPAAAAPQAACSLGGIFGLSAAQSALAEALARGTTLAAYARNTGIAFETARSRLKALLARTGCRRQADLCALLARLGV